MAKITSNTRFWVRLISFLAPFVIIFILFTGLLIYSGESMPLAWVAQMQMSSEPILYRPRYGNRDLAFKLVSANLRAAPILALGSSHILQFRSGFFTGGLETFYNAGAPAWTLTQLSTFVNQLDANAIPQVLILSLDHPWFNRDYHGDTFPDPVSDFDQIFRINRSFIQDVFDGETFDFQQLLTRQSSDGVSTGLGLRALQDGHGFRNDGSEQYGDFLIAEYLMPELERARHMEWMRDGYDMYIYGDEVDAERVAQLTAILDWASSHNILVIGFLPPYMPSLYTEIVQNDQYGYIHDLPATLAPLFSERGFHFLDYSNPELLQAQDTDFFDGWHASELIYLRLYLDMVSQVPAVLSPYTDVEYLRQIEANAQNTFDVFGFHFE